MSFDIYLAIHCSTGLGYVGMTKRGYLVRWEDHVEAAKYSVKIGEQSRMLITRFLVKYGAEAFVVLRIAQTTEVEAAKKLERHFIAYYDTKSPNGLNLTGGGDGVWGYKFTPEQLLRLSQSHLGQGKGRKESPEVCAARSARNKGQKPNTWALGPKPAYIRERLGNLSRGKKIHKNISIAVIASNKKRKGEKRKPYPVLHGVNVSRALSGRIQSKEVVEKRAVACRGKKRSAEFKALCRKNMLARIAAGWKPKRKNS